MQENSFESSNLFEKSIDMKGNEKQTSAPINIDIDASSVHSTPQSTIPHSSSLCLEKPQTRLQTHRPRKSGDPIMYSDRVLFSFTSPFIQNSFDITEYDLVRFIQSSIDFYVHSLFNIHLMHIHSFHL